MGQRVIWANSALEDLEAAAEFIHRDSPAYAIYFNRRHRRWGHLFQNRYKSILCQEEPYFSELVRYIHLNPLRAKLVHDIRQLNTYPYSGHSVIMGKRENDWRLMLWNGNEARRPRPAD